MSGLAVQARSWQSATSMWWIAVDGEPRGPYTEAALRTKLEAREFSRDSLVCPVGGTEWTAASESLAFGLTPSHEATATLSAAAGRAARPDAIAWMVYTISLYAAFGAPLILLLDVAASLTGNSFVSRLPHDSAITGHAIILDTLEFLMQLGGTAFLAISAWRLLAKSRRNVNELMLALLVRITWAVIELPAVIVWFALIELHAPETGNRPFVAWHAFVDSLACVGLLFEVTAVCWLYWYRDSIIPRLGRKA